MSDKDLYDKSRILRFYNLQSAHTWNIMKIIFAFLILMIQSGHKFAYVMTAKLWPDLIIIFQARPIWISIRFQWLLFFKLDRYEY